jgi:hypothetical protein
MIMGKTRPVTSLAAAAFFLVIFLASLFLTVRFHANKKPFKWESEIWSDKAGYYIYLPATFYYHFNTGRMPQHLEDSLGNGFQIDRQRNRLVDKYTCGVAVLVSPFFLATSGISKVAGIPEQEGFSPMFHWMVNISALVYLLLGLILLWKFLEHYFNPLTRYGVVLLTWFGTNLLYYTVVESLMSHVYSFFLVALFLFSLKKFLSRDGHFGYFALMSLASGLIVLVRPVNVIVLSLFFFWDVSSFRDLKDRIRMILRPRFLATFLVIFFLVLLPQMLYWHWISGKYIMNSYTGESFTNWNHPKIIEAWFAPLNGLFLYSPLVLLFIAGMFLMVFRRIRNGILVAAFFLVVSYIISSWWTWYYGCSYGQRSFVDFYAVLCLPFGYLLARILTVKRRILKIILLLVPFTLATFNLAMVRVYEKCFVGSVWDWDNYGRLIGRAKIFPPFRKLNNYTNDFENLGINWGFYLSDTVSHSGKYSMLLNPDDRKYCLYTRSLWKFGKKGIDSAEVVFWAYKLKDLPERIVAVCNLEYKGHIYFSETHTLGHLIETPHRWYRLRAGFRFPSKRYPLADLKIYIRDHDKRYIYVDDLRIRFW